MKYIREYCVNNKMQTVAIIVRTLCYDNSFNYFLKLRKQLRKDFPKLINDKKLNIIHYGGECYKRTFGIEVWLPIDTIIPENYTEISKVEYIL